MESIKVVLQPGAVMPIRATEGSICYDLHYNGPDTTIAPRASVLLGTGVHFGFPPPSANGAVYGGKIHSRSGLSVKKNIDVGAGVIDSDYTGEIRVLLRNTSDTPVEFKAYDRIAQIAIQKYYIVDLIQVESLDDTDRGELGFGSSGN